MSKSSIQRGKRSLGVVLNGNLSFNSGGCKSKIKNSAKLGSLKGTGKNFALCPSLDFYYSWKTLEFLGLLLQKSISASLIPWCSACLSQVSSSGIFPPSVFPSYIKANLKPHMLVHVFNPITWGTEPGRLL